MCAQNVEFLDTFPKLQKATVRFVMPVCPSVHHLYERNNSALTGRIFMKFDT